MGSAIKSSFSEEFKTEIDEIETVAEVSEDTIALAYITRFKGWELLKRKKEALEAFLDDSLTAAIAGGATMSEIGERAVIKDLCKYVLTSLFKNAEDAKRSIDT